MSSAPYWERVRKLAAELESDGCSGVPEFYHDCCLEHDIAYRTHADVDGNLKTRAQADADFRRCMQTRSRLGRFSPISWWRWVAVRLFAKKAWGKNGAT